MNIGEKIKKARLAKGMSQEELGNIVGVQRAAVSKWEKGTVVNIKRSVLQKISEALDIPVQTLVMDSTPEIQKENSIEFTREEDALLQMYRMMNDENKSTILEYAGMLIDKQKENILKLLTQLSENINNPNFNKKEFMDEALKYVGRSDNNNNG